jgi:hypothetical protein
MVLFGLSITQLQGCGMSEYRIQVAASDVEDGEDFCVLEIVKDLVVFTA